MSQVGSDIWSTSASGIASKGSGFSSLFSLGQANLVVYSFKPKKSADPIKVNKNTKYMYAVDQEDAFKFIFRATTLFQIICIVWNKCCRKTKITHWTLK